MSENQAETSPRKRRWLQYSLRSLLALTVVVAGGASWLAVRIQEAREQKQAVDEIKKAGGSVKYGSGGWLARLCGQDFDPVVEVRFGQGVVLGDSELQQVRGLRRLEHIQACRSRVTDTGLQHLKGLARLRSLRLYSRAEILITDTGFQYLEHLPQLEDLLLMNTAVTDAGLARLKGLTRLKRLYLRSSTATPKGVEDIQRALPDAKISVLTSEDSEEKRKTLAGDVHRDP